LEGLVPEISPSKFLVQAGWADIPHLPIETQAELLASTPPHLRDSRSAGSPSLGIGAIYPVPLSDIIVDPFQPPAFWPRCYGFDVGWQRTAAVWGAYERSSDCWFLYTEHYRAQAEPSIHATAIKARGEWVPGVIDPASRGRSQTDGHALLDIYLQLGLKVVPADNRVTGEEGGLYAVWERLSTGRLKVFRTLQNWQREYRLYRRDEKGKVVKKDDHLMDATRYLVMSGREHAITQPVAKQFTGPGSAAGGDRRAGY
jgi:hypothetical protein